MSFERRVRRLLEQVRGLPLPNAEPFHVRLHGETLSLTLAAMKIASKDEFSQILDDIDAMLMYPPQPSAGARYIRTITRLKEKVMKEARARRAGWSLEPEPMYEGPRPRR